MHSDKKRCADTLSLSRQAEQNRAEERVSIDTKKGSKYNKSNEKRGGGIQLKKRKWKFRIAGGAVTLLGIYLMAVGYGETITLTIATVVLIFGIAIWSMATPESYNSMTDMIAMISMEKPRKIEEFYEAYKNVDTPFGSAWLAKFYTMRQKALVFGPDAKGEYLYFWLTKDGHVGYLGYSFIEDFIKKKLTTPVYPIHEDVAENLADHLSYHSDLMMFQSELKANLEHFVKNGTVQPFQKISASQIYTFTEDYRLTGQHFDLEDTDGNLVYEIDSTVPLKTFYIYDAMHTEIFRMTKELLHALPTYRFYLYGEPYGVLKKQFALVRDRLVWLRQNPLLAHAAAFAGSFLLCGGRPQGRCAGTGRGLSPAPGLSDQGVQQHRLFQVHALQPFIVYPQRGRHPEIRERPDYQHQGRGQGGRSILDESGNAFVLRPDCLYHF